MKNRCGLVVGPDAYLDLTNLICAVEKGEKHQYQPSRTETYQKVIPARQADNFSDLFPTRGCKQFLFLLHCALYAG
jgi:tRNA-2-methylthio-N6-dimethylallyladenosine synthase